MDNKRLIHAVAGSGKTTKIIESIDPQKRNLILTYTETNQNTIRAKLIEKFGYIPESTFIFGVFEFLYSFCLVPYLGKRPKGILVRCFHANPSKANRIQLMTTTIINFLSDCIILVLALSIFRIYNKSR